MFSLFGVHKKKSKRRTPSVDFGGIDKAAVAPGFTFSDRAPLNSLAIERVRLAQGISYRMPSALAYTNMNMFNERVALHLVRDVYSDRVARVEPIDLVRLETATIYPDDDFVVNVGLVAIEEQIPPWRKDKATVTVRRPQRNEEILQETVIISRFGLGTWGHWLGELLPKIVMIEAAFPNRFSFAVPHAFDTTEWKNFRQSISMYGILHDRLVFLESDRAYVLKRAWALTSVWSDHVMHPAATDLMRSSLRTSSQNSGSRKVALLRRREHQRTLENWEDLATLLSGEGYEPVDIAQLSVDEQVRTFQSADAVFGTLGSGLTGLIYSPVGVAVTSVAPAIFGDRFFYALVVNRRGCFADVRGPIVSPDPNIPHRGSFTIDPAHVADALRAVDEIH